MCFGICFLRLWRFLSQAAKRKEPEAGTISGVGRSGRAKSATKPNTGSDAIVAVGDVTNNSSLVPVSDTKKRKTNVILICSHCGERSDQGHSQ